MNEQFEKSEIAKDGTVFKLTISLFNKENNIDNLKGLEIELGKFFSEIKKLGFKEVNSTGIID